VFEQQRSAEIMKVQLVAISLIAIILTGCATTPVVMLKNDVTGEVVQCGGKNESKGYIEYSIQKEYDDSCVHFYESQGFKRIQ
jgi:hypothetical protein